MSGDAKAVAPSSPTGVAGNGSVDWRQFLETVGEELRSRALTPSATAAWADFNKTGEVPSTIRAAYNRYSDEFPELREIVNAQAHWAQRA